MVISEYLFSMLPENDEGDLTKVKSVVVSGESLTRLGIEIGVDKYLLIGKGLRLKSEIPRSLIANVMEAIIAAVYLDRGMEAARHFVLDHLHGYVEEVLNDDHDEKNYKSLLQQHAQKTLGQTPQYHVLGERGPDHSKVFRVSAVIGRKEYPPGKGACKKDAEQDAARIAHQRLLEAREPPPKKGRKSGQAAGRPAEGSRSGKARKPASRSTAKKPSKAEPSPPARKRAADGRSGPARKKSTRSAPAKQKPDGARPPDKAPEVKGKRKGRRRKPKAESATDR